MEAAATAAVSLGFILHNKHVPRKYIYKQSTHTNTQEEGNSSYLMLQKGKWPKQAGLEVATRKPSGMLLNFLYLYEL